MAAVDSISASDRRLMKRLTVALALLFICAAAWTRLHALYSGKFFDITGRAEWIWAQHPMSAGTPLAFFAVRDVDLPERRYYTRIKLLGDPEYVLWVNGRIVGARRVGEERRLDQYDVSNLVRTGRNRIVIAVRSPQGVGGLLASLDLAPETENWLVTDGQWRIYRRWSDALLLRNPPALPWEAPMIVGEPPIGRWNYLAMAMQPLATAEGEVLQPARQFEVTALRPAIRTVSGVAVAVAEKEPATAFDFGFTKGRLRLKVHGPRFGSRTVAVRFANVESELGVIDWGVRQVVFAPGEDVVTIPETRSFRYVLAFGRGVTAEVVRSGG